MSQDIIRLVPVLLTWAALVYKLPSVRKPGAGPATRALWDALLLFAGGMTILLPPAYAAIDRAVGVPNLARLLAHALIVAASWRALAFLYHLNYPDQEAEAKIRRVGWLGVAALLLLVASFAAAGPGVDEPVAFTDRYADSVFIVTYRLAFLAYIGLMLVHVVRLSLQYAGVSRSRPALHLGLCLGAAGALVGIGYVVHGILYLAERRVELGYAVPDVLASTTLGAVSVTLVVIGATMPAWGSRVGIPSAYRWLDRRRACRRLYPLWRDLCRAAPDIALDAVPSGLADALVVQDLGFRLYRRVVEIRDGRLAVGTHLPPGVAEHAESMGRDAGLTGNKLHAVVEAGCLRAAIQARSLAYQNSGNPALPPTIGGAEVADEVAFLELVADAYRRSPIVRAVVADLRVDQATR